MLKTRRPQLHVERLEERDCPAVTATLLANQLILRGRPNGEMLIEGQGGNDFTLSINGNTVATFNLGGRGLIVQMPSRNGELNIDLKNNNIGGNVLIDLGNGHTGKAVNLSSVDIYDSLVDGTQSQIRGNVQILRGNGREFLNIGGFETGPTLGVPNPTPAPISILGNLTAVGRSSAVAPPFIGDALTLVPGSGAGVLGTEVRGSVSATQIETVSVGLQGIPTDPENGTRVLGSVTATNINAPLSMNVFGTVSGNVSARGMQNDDTFTLGLEADPAGLGDSIGGVIEGSLSVGFGEGFNIFQIQDSSASDDVAQVFGNVSFTSGTGDDFAILSGQVFGSVNFNLGQGANGVVFSNFLSPVTNSAFVGGNFSITAGNGDNAIGGLFFGGFSGDIGGNLTMNLGNGANFVSLDAGLDVGGSASFYLGSGDNVLSDNADFIGGTFRMRTGNGNNTVDLNRTALYVLDMLFGNADDTITFNGGLGTQVTGRLFGGGRLAANIVNQNSAEFLPTLILADFP